MARRGRRCGSRRGARRHRRAGRLARQLGSSSARARSSACTGCPCSSSGSACGCCRWRWWSPGSRAPGGTRAWYRPPRGIAAGRGASGRSAPRPRRRRCRESPSRDRRRQPAVRLFADRAARLSSRLVPRQRWRPGARCELATRPAVCAGSRGRCRVRRSADRRTARS